jgi:clan AA aspartic protease
MVVETKRPIQMGIIYTDIELVNAKDLSLKPVVCQAMVDSGAVNLYIPEHIMHQLKLEQIEQREVTLADGHNKVVPYVGPIQIKFENRSCFAGALVLGDEVLLGVVPMEDMDLIINPRQEKLTVNPKSPNIPSAKVK